MVTQNLKRIQTQIQTSDDLPEGTTSLYFSSAEKSKLSGIEPLAQVNTVDSVSGKTGVVTLISADVGLGNVTNNAQLTIANNLSDVANVATSRLNLGLVIGVDVQAWSSNLDSINQNLSTTDDVVFNSLDVSAGKIQANNLDLGLGIVNGGTYQNRFVIKNFDPTADNSYLEIDSTTLNNVTISSKKTSDGSLKDFNFNCNNTTFNLVGTGINTFIINKDDGITPRQPLQLVSIFGNDDWIFGDGANAKIIWNNQTLGSGIVNLNGATTYSNDQLRDKTIEIIDIIKEVFK